MELAGWLQGRLSDAIFVKHQTDYVRILRELESKGKSLADKSGKNAMRRCRKTVPPPPVLVKRLQVLVSRKCFLLYLHAQAVKLWRRCLSNSLIPCSTPKGKSVLFAKEVLIEMVPRFSRSLCICFWPL
jgi:hypothetical protein